MSTQNNQSLLKRAWNTVIGTGRLEKHGITPTGANEIGGMAMGLISGTLAMGYVPDMPIIMIPVMCLVGHLVASLEINEHNAQLQKQSKPQQPQPV